METYVRQRDGEFIEAVATDMGLYVRGGAALPHLRYSGDRYLTSSTQAMRLRPLDPNDTQGGDDVGSTGTVDERTATAAPREEPRSRRVA